MRKSPNLSSSSKLDSRWHGPWKIVQRRGEYSYQAVDPMGRFHDVHMEQLKPFMDDEVLYESPMHSHSESLAKRLMGEVIGHRISPFGQDEFLVQMEDLVPSEASWLKVPTMLQEGLELPSRDQCREKGWSPVMYSESE